MSQTSLVDLRSAVRGIVGRYDEPADALPLRMGALEAYLSAPLPDRVQHLWRYTDPALFAVAEEVLASGAGRPRGLNDAERFGTGDPDDSVASRLAAGTLSGAVLSDGASAPIVRVSSDLERQGVKVLDLHEALRTVSAARDFFGRLVGRQVSPDGRGKFEALNLALWSAGAFIHVPRNVRVAQPIQLLLSLPRGGAGPSFISTRVLVVLDEGAELTVVDECEGGGSGVTLNSVFELFAGQSSRLRHVAVQRLERDVRYYVTQRVSVGRDANLLTAMASLGAGVTKSDFGSFLEGLGANVELVGFLYGEGKQHFDHHTVHEHRCGHTHSNLDFKVVIKDRARSAYTGLIRIDKEAPESEAYQENRNLLLSDGAKAESIPELEILTDEVKCTHGATVGTLDSEHLFYLMCRGLNRGEAIRLIVGGFIEPTMSRIPEDLRERLSSHVEQRIADL